MSTHTLRCLVLKSSGSPGYGIKWNHIIFMPELSQQAGCKSTTRCDMDHVAVGHYRRSNGTVLAMDLRRLTYFVAVAEEQHFGRAAARLHMTAPPLSQRIRELEAELGVQLFERSTRQVHLTPAGSRLLHEARSTLRAIDRLTGLAESLRRAADSANQPLTLAYCHGSEHMALEAAATFHDRHPQTSVRPAALTSLRIFKDLRDGRVTVAMARSPILFPERLASQFLARVPFDHVAVPSSHPLAEHDVVHASDLDGQPVLLVERDDAPTYHDSTLAYCAAHDVQPSWVIHPATQVERMLDMVAVGS